MAAERTRRALALALMFGSGAAGLALQIVWTQQNALWLGHEAAAVLAVVAALFGGIAAGAFMFGPRIERSARPARWYAACELVIAVWTVTLVIAMPGVAAALSRAIGIDAPAPAQWLAGFAGTFVLLLPATAAMGATLPAMERVLQPLRAAGGSLPALYAANTLGAVAGVLTCAYWLVPALGLRATSLICASVDIACAIVALLAFDEMLPPGAPSQAPPRRVFVWLSVTGFLGIGYEVLVVRVIAQVAEDTVYTYAMLLAVYLAASAAGAAFYQRGLARAADSARLDSVLLALLSLACLAGGATLWGAEGLRDFALARLGPGMVAAVATETLLAVASFAVPAWCMGVVFSHLMMRAHAAGASFGRALGANTLGAALAPIVFGVWALPLLGAKFAVLIVSAGYLFLVSANGWRRPLVWLPAMAVGAAAAVAPPLAFIAVPAGGHVVSYEEGALASVSVVEDADGVAVLRIDNRQQEGSSATRRVDARQALLPLLLHPAPNRALFLGLGTGVTATSATLDTGLEVDAVELLPEVLHAANYFTQPITSAAQRARFHAHVADARRFVRSDDAKYDVIVADNYHPARSGAASLYTVEHFAAIRDRLAPQGLFCQWLPLHQLDLPTLRSIVRSFMAVYPDGWALLASNSLETPVLGLVARADHRRFDVQHVRARLRLANITPSPAEFGIEDVYALLGSFVAGPDSLRRFAGDSVLNTDDRPIVAYRAPRVTYAPDSRPHERLGALLAELDLSPVELVDDADGEFAQRLAAYFAARDRFIIAGANVRPSSDVRAMLIQVREPLLAVLRTSPDFRPAYDPLLMMAAALARSDADAARALLGELERVQPERDDARLALRSLSGAR